MTSNRECYVYIVLPGETSFITAGRLQVTSDDDGDVGSFVYGRRYLERKDAVEIDPVELLLDNRVYETTRMKGIFGSLRDAMPDFWGRRVIEKHTGITTLNEFDYLLEGPDDRAGALGFGLGQTPPAPLKKFSKTIDLARIQEVADAIINEAKPVGDDIAQIEEYLLVGTSMGGARPKAVVDYNNALWIAKFGRQDDRWNNPRVEHGTLLLARSCGLEVAESQVTTVGEKDVLLVRRFDRDKDKTLYRRHRMVSALTLLKSSDSPNDRDEWSYLLLADEIRRISERNSEDLRELFARICFNAAVSNSDDHPRNHAILAKDKGWRLSPAFDLTPTPSVSVDRRNLALICGLTGRYANRENIISAHGRFLLEKKQAESIFDGIVGSVKAEWHSTMRRAGVSETDCMAIESSFNYEGMFYSSEP